MSYVRVVGIYFFDLRRLRPLFVPLGFALFLDPLPLPLPLRLPLPFVDGVLSLLLSLLFGRVLFLLFGEDGTGGVRLTA